MSWRCFFGFHRWSYRVARRDCLRCGRRERVIDGCWTVTDEGHRR